MHHTVSTHTISYINKSDNIYNEFKNINKNYGRAIINLSTIKAIRTGIVFNGVHNEIGCNLSLNSSYVNNGHGPGIVFKCDNKGARFLNMNVNPNILFFGTGCDFPDKVHIDELYVADSNANVKISFVSDENIVIKKSSMFL